MVSSQTADTRELRQRAAVMARREPLPARQRKLKMGTTSFMLVMHVLATVAVSYTHLTLPTKRIV